ncbi:alpha/beta hydrolase [Achromobacter xylosoxidans]
MSAAPMPEPTALADVRASGRDLRLEYQWIPASRQDAPLLVFLHEGLGSVSMWKDWPRQACEAAGCRGLVYSRYGYGRSTPLATGEKRAIDFMHREAADALPALLAALGIDAKRDRPILFGHSDGGSIALLYAAMHPDAVAGVVVAAPHIFVEDRTVAHIEQARQAYRDTDLRARLARHHDDVDSAFRGWNDVWLDPPSGAGTSRITCPPSPARCWRCRAWTMSTARSNRYAVSGAPRRRRGCWKFPTAAIRRTRTSPPP